MNARAIIDTLNMLWPKLLLWKGVLFPQSVSDYDVVLHKWMEHSSGNVDAAEAAINHVRVADIVLDTDGYESLSLTDLQLIARTYCALLANEIERVAPGRKYKIWIENYEQPIAPSVNERDLNAFAVELCDMEVWFHLERETDIHID